MVAPSLKYVVLKEKTGYGKHVQGHTDNKALLFWILNSIRMVWTMIRREMELEVFILSLLSTYPTGAMPASVIFNLPLIAFHWKVALASLGICSSLPLIFFTEQETEREREHLLCGISSDAPSHCSVNTSKVPQTDPFLTCLLSLSQSFTRHVNIVTSIAFGNSQDWRHLFIEECPMPEIKKNHYLRNSVLPNAIRFDYRTPRIAHREEKKMKTLHNVLVFQIMALMIYMSNHSIVLSYWIVDFYYFAFITPAMCFCPLAFSTALVCWLLLWSV